MNNSEYMKKACELSELSVKRGGGPFGCVICAHDGEIVGKGHNMVTINNDPTQHAEIVAIRDACRFLNTIDLSGCTLYTSCEPCPMCLSAIYWSHIHHVYYGNNRKDAKNIGFDDEYIYDEIKKPLEDRNVKMLQCCKDDAKDTFQLWLEKDDKFCY
jgi:tRNA(Arg) A34 adenosine deaminase TadA